jgi:hypothetical protein
LNAIGASFGGDFQPVIVGVANVLAVTVALLTIDKIGRRTLLLIGSWGSAIPLALCVRQWEAAIGTGEFIAHEEQVYLVKNSAQGTVAHVSKDLKNWAPEPMVLLEGVRGTCPHWFKWNDWYYLTAGNAFFQSRRPLGPWKPIPLKTLSTKITHVKTAPWKGGRRIGGDWIGDGGWGGDLVIRELVQHEDGDLTWKFLPELIPATGDPLDLPFATLGKGASQDGKSIHVDFQSVDEPAFCALDKLPKDYRLTATVRPGKGVRHSRLMEIERAGLISRKMEIPAQQKGMVELQLRVAGWQPEAKSRSGDGRTLGIRVHAIDVVARGSEDSRLFDANLGKWLTESEPGI